MVFSEEDKALTKNLYLIKGYTNHGVSWKGRKAEKVRIVETLGEQQRKRGKLNAMWL